MVGYEQLMDGGGGAGGGSQHRNREGNGPATKRGGYGPMASQLCVRESMLKYRVYIVTRESRIM